MAYDWSKKDVKTGFNVFSVHDEVSFNRLGRKIYVKGRDGTQSDSDTVEANLLFELLKAIRKSK